MNFQYETKHLILKILEPSSRSANQVLDFYNRNRIIFERYEATRSADFYTKEHQKLILTNEFNLAITEKCIRFWVYEKNNPDFPIGTICFYNIVHSIYDRCETGYKFDSHYWHKGYAKEAMAVGISLMFQELNLHRIEAFVMKENKASIRLLRNLNFQYEGICRKAIRIRGSWEDHILFARIR